MTGRRVCGLSAASKGFIAVGVILAAFGGIHLQGQVPTGGASQATSVPTSKPAISNDEILRAVKNLGAAKWQDRQDANERLRAIDRPAIPAIQQAIKSDDAEVAARAAALLEDFKWGLFADTPKELAELIQQYRAADSNVKGEIFNKMMALESANLAALAQLASAEENTNIRQYIAGQLQNKYTSALPGLIASGDLATAETILEQLIASGQDRDIRNYVTFLLLTDKLDAKIAKLSADDGKENPKLLILAYRAKGDLASALKIAKKHDCLRRELLIEAGDWKALVELQDASVPDSGEAGTPEELGYQLAFHRLAGDKAGADKIADRIAKLIESNPEQTWNFIKQLLLNEYIDKAVELAAGNKHEEAAFDILIAQGRFAKALEVAAKVPDVKGQPLPGLLYKAAQTKYVLGQKEEALATLQSLLGEPQDDPTFNRRRSIATAYRVLGLKEQADKTMVDLLEPLPTSKQDMVYDVAPPEFAQYALLWWVAIRQDSDLSLTDSLEKLRQVLAGKLPLKELESLAATAAKVSLENTDNESPTGEAYNAADRFRAIVSVLLLYKDAPNLEDYFTQWQREDPRGAAELTHGWELEKLDKWAKAADLYKQAVTKGPRVPLYAMLQGVALVKAGQKEAGQKLMLTADLMVIGNDYQRVVIANLLSKRDNKELASRQIELLLRTGAFTGNDIANAIGDYAYQDALNNKKYDLAVLLQMRRCLLFIPDYGGSTMQETSGYISLMFDSHMALAIKAKNAGDWNKYAAEIATCQKTRPDAWDHQVIDEINDLDHADKKELADAIFNTTWNFSFNIANTWPEFVDGNNATAWFAARCHRKLDEAVKLSLKAVEQEPKNPNVLDTLAEIYFQKGDKDKAIELGKKCLELDAEIKDSKITNYFKRQIKRYEANDPTSAPSSPLE